MSLPTFGYRAPIPPRLMEQLAAEMGGAYPVVRVSRAALARMPLYETTEPTGPRVGFRWITRDPYKDRAYHGPQAICFLREVTPLEHPKGGQWIYTWQLEIEEDLA